MSENRRGGRGKLLTILWLVTAATALIVTVVYFGRLEKMYAVINKIENSSAGDTVTHDKKSDVSGQKNVPNGKNIEGEKTKEDVTVTADPEATPMPEPTATPTPEPTATPTPEPTATPTPEPTPTPDPDKPYYYDYSLDPSKPIIALSFDDGPSLHTLDILKILEKYGAKATFFMVGYQIDAYSEVVQAVYDAGCQIGNHTTDHENLAKCSADKIKSQIFKNEDKLNNIVPVGRIIVRPPYGEYNDTVKSIVDRPMFNWSVDSEDWKSRNAQSIFKEVKANAKDGYIILCHDLYDSTAEAVELFVPWLIEQGYQVTCISNMYEARGEETKDGHIYRYTDPAPVPEP